MKVQIKYIIFQQIKRNFFKVLNRSKVVPETAAGSLICHGNCFQLKAVLDTFYSFGFSPFRLKLTFHKQKTNYVIESSLFRRLVFHFRILFQILNFVLAWKKGWLGFGLLEGPVNVFFLGVSLGPLISAFTYYFTMMLPWFQKKMADVFNFLLLTSKGSSTTWKSQQWNRYSIYFQFLLGTVFVFWGNVRSQLENKTVEEFLPFNGTTSFPLSRPRLKRLTWMHRFQFGRRD